MTAFVASTSNISELAKLDSPAFIGTPALPAATTLGGVSLTTQLAAKMPVGSAALTCTYAAGPPQVYTVTISPAFTSSNKYQVILEPMANGTNIPYISAKSASGFTITGSASSFAIVTGSGYFGAWQVLGVAPYVQPVTGS